MGAFVPVYSEQLRMAMLGSGVFGGQWPSTVVVFDFLGSKIETTKMGTYFNGSHDAIYLADEVQPAVETVGDEVRDAIYGYISTSR